MLSSDMGLPREHILLCVLWIHIVFVVGAHASCVLHLDVASSSLAFAGASAASIVSGSFPATAKDDARFGLSGTLYAHLDAADSCPTTPQGWAQAAPLLVITSAPSPFHYQPLEVFPEQMQLAVLGIPLNISSLALNVTMTGAAAAAPNAVKLAINAVIANGYAFSDTPMTGGPQLQRFAVEKSSSTASATIAVNKQQGNSSTLDITIPDFNVTFVTKTNGVVGGKPWNGSLTFSLSGPVKLSGLLSCPKDCGDFGRCVTLNSTAVSTAANSSSAVKYACECQCGWAVDPASGRCEVPAGTCPVYGSDSSSRGLSLISNTTSNASQGSSSCSDSAAVSSQGGACPNNYGFDVFTKTCAKCEADWSGPGCKLCTTDKACQAKLSKSNAICNTGLLYNERSSEKYYSCSLSDQSIARLIGPILPITCKTAGSDSNGKQTAGSALAVNDNSLLNNQASCSIAMRLIGMPAGTYAQCIATGCHFSAGEPSFVCDGVTCDCPQGCPAMYMKTFKGVSGAVKLTCDTTGQDCKIVIGSLNMNIAASCEASECLDPTGPKLVGTGGMQQSAPPVAPPLVAMLPLLFLVLGALACGAALARYKAYLRGKGRNSSSSVGGAAAAMAGKGVGTVPGAQNARRISGGSDGATAVPMLVGSVGSEAAAARTAGTGTAGGAILGAHVPGFRQIGMLSFSEITADVRVPRTWREYLSSTASRRQAAAAPERYAGGGLKDSNGPYDLEKGSSDEDAATPNSAGGSQPDGVSSNGVAIFQQPTAAEAGAATAAATSGRPPRPSSIGDSSIMTGGSSGGAGSSRWRPVLRGVSGSVASGQVLGVMGPSGGGKSTLLLKLCGSLGAGGNGSTWRSSGLVCLDGVVAPPSLLSAVTALVPQDDTLMRSLTVEECIRYSAALRLDPSLPPAVVSARVEDVMARLGLTHIRGSTVLSGTGVSGVSGGERRRVGIGMELVIDPQVLVLDEPLSGLDSFTALQLMKTLQSVAASGRVVALSLHQPSPVIFSSLDSAMLLAAGLMVYSGPPAAAAAALERLGCPVPENITVAEHMLHVVSDPESLQVVVAAALQRQQAQRAVLGHSRQQQQLIRSTSSDSNSPDQAPSWSLAAGGAGQGPVAEGKNASHAGDSSNRISNTGTGRFKSLKNAAATFSPRPSASGQARMALGLPSQKRPLSRQVGVLFWRGLLDMLRNPLLTAFHSLGGLLLGLLVGIIFFQVKNDTAGAQNRVGAIFFALCLLAFTSVTSVDLVQAESGAAGREMQRKYYSPVAYAATKLVLDGLLLRALPALLFTLPFYFLMGLSATALQFFVFLLVLIAFSATVGALALGFASALNSPGKTILVMNLVLLLGVLFGGFLANKGSIPVWLRWISWLSVFRYSWEALVINELSGIDLFLSAPGVSLSLPVKGQVFLEVVGVNSQLFMVDIGVLIAMYFACCAFVVFVVCWRNRQLKH